MSSWLDIAFLAIFLLSVFSGLKRGMIRQLCDLIGFIVSWVLALKLGPGVGEWLDSIFDISIFLRNIDNEIFSFLQFEEYVVTLMGVFWVLSLCGIFFMLLGRILCLVNSLPFIKQVNSALGAVLGGAKGILSILFIIIILNFLPLPAIIEAKETSTWFSSFEKYAMEIIDLGLESLTV
ncbi:CvpA family protein [Candidatus Contubernalis alkaliaceticus]|uniref:CvpA family protein n=1 Tax=Candidatus Contubernalis alkaliaceticus TaxID=338645 RepID=UPI001F4BD92C|nr:CvpA family protein [Candidatus Contubernalis alkalaceticus]UNC92642.1 CvpA family protein [Candidatus Contubernalis alkalaceticus]